MSRSATPVSLAHLFLTHCSSSSMSETFYLSTCLSVLNLVKPNPEHASCTGAYTEVHVTAV